MHVDGAVVHTGGLGGGRALNEPFLEEVGYDRVALHRGVDSARVEGEPGLGRVVPDLYAQSLSDVFSVEQRLFVVVDRDPKRALAIEAVLRLHRLLVTNGSEPHRSERAGSSMDRIAVSLDGHQAWDPPHKAVEFQGRAVGIYIEQREEIGITQAKSCFGPLVGSWKGDEVGTRDPAARAGRAARLCISPRRDAGRQPFAGSQSIRIIGNEVDDKPE